MGVVEHSRLSYVIRKNLEPESETQHLSFCPHILLADNDTMTRRLVAWGLRKSGYEVTESTCSALLCELVDLKSGRDFLSLFDLVITIRTTSDPTRRLPPQEVFLRQAQRQGIF